LVVAEHLVHQLVQLLLMQTGLRNQHHQLLVEMDQHLHLEASLQLAAAVAVEAIASMAHKAVLAVAPLEEEPVVQLAATQRHLVGQVLKTAEQVVIMVAVVAQAVQVHQLEEALV
jgi:hypothetical protein